MDQVRYGDFPYFPLFCYEDMPTGIKNLMEKWGHGCGKAQWLKMWVKTTEKQKKTVHLKWIWRKLLFYSSHCCIREEMCHLANMNAVHFMYFVYEQPWTACTFKPKLWAFSDFFASEIYSGRKKFNWRKCWHKCPWLAGYQHTKKGLLLQIFYISNKNCLVSRENGWGRWGCFNRHPILGCRSACRDHNKTQLLETCDSSTRTVRGHPQTGNNIL